MPETELLNLNQDRRAKVPLLIRKAESLPPPLFEEAAHYIDYLSQKAHTAYVAEKLAEVERDMAKPGAKWLTEEEFWDEDD
jgi:hypothetical protein